METLSNLLVQRQCGACAVFAEHMRRTRAVVTQTNPQIQEYGSPVHSVPRTSTRNRRRQSFCSYKKPVPEFIQPASLHAESSCTYKCTLHHHWNQVNEFEFPSEVGGETVRNCPIQRYLPVTAGSDKSIIGVSRNNSLAEQIPISAVCKLDTAAKRIHYSHTRSSNLYTEHNNAIQKHLQQDPSYHDSATANSNSTTECISSKQHQLCPQMGSEDSTARKLDNCYQDQECHETNESHSTQLASIHTGSRDSSFATPSLTLACDAPANGYEADADARAHEEFKRPRESVSTLQRRLHSECSKSPQCPGNTNPSHEQGEKWTAQAASNGLHKKREIDSIKPQLLCTSVAVQTGLQSALSPWQPTPFKGSHEQQSLSSRVYLRSRGTPWGSLAEPSAFRSHRKEDALRVDDALQVARDLIIPDEPRNTQSIHLLSAPLCPRPLELWQRAHRGNRRVSVRAPVALSDSPALTEATSRRIPYKLLSSVRVSSPSVSCAASGNLPSRLQENTPPTEMLRMQQDISAVFPSHPRPEADGEPKQSNEGGTECPKRWFGKCRLWPFC